MKKICHLTSAHQTDDDRIFHKECVSLAAAGYDCYLVGCGEDREERGVHVRGVGPLPAGRRERMTGFAEKVYQAALRLDCDVYHFHDPELLPYGLRLKKAGKKVIFDSHEDVPAQILDKEWLPAPARRIASLAYRSYETRAVRPLDAVITATGYIAGQFQGRAKRVEVINNYPILGEIRFHDTPFAERAAIACYAGGISALRGEQIMADAMRSVEGELMIAGEHARESLENGSSRIEYLGKLDREGVNALYGRAVVGLCLLKPAANYVNSQPIKMYEYMAAGLPFICSDFPAWRKVAEESGAGICVSPEDIGGIASAITQLLRCREQAQQMGRKGRKAVEERYHWGCEEKKLLALYQELTQSR